MGSGKQTQVLVLLRQGLFQLSLLPSSWLLHSYTEITNLTWRQGSNPFLQPGGTVCKLIKCFVAQHDMVVSVTPGSQGSLET